MLVLTFKKEKEKSQTNSRGLAGQLTEVLLHLNPGKPLHELSY